jgi:hypothetical protein
VVKARKQKRARNHVARALVIGAGGAFRGRGTALEGRGSGCGDAWGWRGARVMDALDLGALLPCPFCGAGETRTDETHLPPRMSGPGALVSVEIRHWCAPMEGMLSRSSVAFAGRDHAAAAAAWNRRTGGGG